MSETLNMDETPAVAVQRVVRRLREQAQDLAIMENLKSYAVQNIEAANMMEAMSAALENSASTMRALANQKCRFEEAVNQTLECTNGHYNPLMKCGCYQKAHDLVMPPNSVLGGAHGGKKDANGLDQGT